MDSILDVMSKSPTLWLILAFSIVAVGVAFTGYNYWRESRT